MRTAVLLLAAALAATGCGASGPAAEHEPATAPTAPPVLAYVWDGKPLLVRADALGLERRGPALDPGEPPISTWATSPRGDRAVLGSGDGARLGFADLRRMRSLGTLDLGARGYVAGLAWTGPRRVVAVLSGLDTEVLVVDPEPPRVLARHALRGVVTRAAPAPQGLVLLLAPADDVGPATLAVATPAGVRTAPLSLDVGVSPPDVHEPGLAVSPDGRRAVVVPGGARVLEVDLRTLAVTPRELATPVSLLGRLRAWLEPEARAKGPLEGPVRSAAWVGHDAVVVAGWSYRPTGERTMVSEAAGVRLVDTTSWTVRTLHAEASAALVAGGTVLAFGGTVGPDGLRGTGLRGFDVGGNERFHLFGDRHVGAVAAVGGYAYVAEQSETQTRIDVVDLAAGAVVATVRKDAYFEVLQLD